MTVTSHKTDKTANRTRRTFTMLALALPLATMVCGTAKSDAAQIERGRYLTPDRGLW